MCLKHPGFEVDLRVQSDIRIFVEAWRGISDLRAEIAARRIRVSGPTRLCRQFPRLASAQPACPVSAEAPGARTATHAHRFPAQARFRHERRTRSARRRVSWRAVAPARPQDRCHDPADRPGLLPGAAGAAREAVLSQVKLPHNYYWRELYIPQLTTGPLSVAFMPSGEELIYSMDGSLWRQRIGSGDAFEITHADGAYDSPAGRRAGRRAAWSSAATTEALIELWRLDLASGATESSDRERRRQSRAAHLPGRTADRLRLDRGHRALQPEDRRPLTRRALERALPRRAAREPDRPLLLFHARPRHQSVLVAGREARLVRHATPRFPGARAGSAPIAVTGGEPACLDKHQLETSWAARPEVGPDGKRILFSNYHGGQWHQLWLTTTDDAAPLPLTYGEFDRRNARWSPDGKRIAYISNEDGNTALWVQEVFGGATSAGEIRRTPPPARRAASFLHIRPQDCDRPADLRARCGARQRQALAWRPAGAGCTATSSTTARSSRAKSTTFTAPRSCRCSVKVPPGKTTIQVQSGFRSKHVTDRARVPGRRSRPSCRSACRTTTCPPDFGKFLSADLHVHMNYGGHYRSTPETLLAQQEAEDLDVVYNLLVNKEERIPDIGYFQPGGDADPASGKRLLFHAQEYHTSFWGHLGLLNLEDHYLLPDYTAYRHTALASPWPNNGAIADLAHAQGALVGYVHIADLPDRSAEGEGPLLRAAGDRRPRQGGLPRGDGLLRPPHHRGHLVSPAEPRLPPAGGRGYRRDGELRLAARSHRPRARVPRDGRRAHAAGARAMR